jgi:hypothetical protein
VTGELNTGIHPIQQKWIMNSGRWAVSDNGGPADRHNDLLRRILDVSWAINPLVQRQWESHSDIPAPYRSHLLKRDLLSERPTFENRNSYDDMLLFSMRSTAVDQYPSHDMASPLAYHQVLRDLVGDSIWSFIDSDYVAPRFVLNEQVAQAFTGCLK